MIKNIIFDFGGVILKHKNTLMEEKIAEIFSIPIDQALELWKPAKPLLLTGQISSEQFLTGLREKLRSSKTLPQILKEWDDIYSREAENVDWGLLDFIEMLKSNYDVFLFTDTIDTHDRYNSTRGIYDKFTKVFKSHEEGLTKLNDDAFLNVLKQVHANPQDCIFIDDLEANIERAKNLGLIGILYKNRENLQQELSKLGIISNNNHQQKQIKVINQIESQVLSNYLKFSLVSPVEDYDNDPRTCLTSVHIPFDSLKQKIQDEIIKPLKEIASDIYFYSPDSMHMTIKNIRVINNPPHFTDSDIEKAKQIFSGVVPNHHKYKVYFYRLLLFPNNLALMGTTDPELDNIVLDLDKRLKEAGIPDDKQYTNSQYFFSNMTLARFSNPSNEFVERVKELSGQIRFEPYTVNSLTLVTCNAVFKNLRIIGEWKLS